MHGSHHVTALEAPAVWQRRLGEASAATHACLHAHGQWSFGVAVAASMQATLHAFTQWWFGLPAWQPAHLTLCHVNVAHSGRCTIDHYTIHVQHFCWVCRVKRAWVAAARQVQVHACTTHAHANPGHLHTLQLHFIAPWIFVTT